MVQFISAKEAAQLVSDNHTVTVGGFVGFGAPEEILTAIEERYLETGAPKNLFVMNCAGCGDKGNRGMNHFGHEGLVRKVYCGHIGLAPKLGNLLAQNKVAGYCVPQGVTVHLLRAIAGKKPGVLTHVGLNTYADPRVEGCRINEKSTEEVVKLLEIEGQEYLLYKTFPVNVAIIRGTTADEKGNLTVEKEALFLEQILMAQAAKNSGGIVIAQVERVAKYGTLNPQDVKVPGIFVDYVVQAKPEHHPQSFVSPEYNASWSGEIRIPLNSLEKMPLDERKIIARRGAVELKANAVVNLGIGVPEGVANIAAEEGFSQAISLSIESGTVGGIPAGGLGIGATYNPDAIIDQAYQFDFYDGGGLDCAYLGAAEMDQAGNVNVSKFSGRVVGPGGFVNITQNAKKVCFCGTFTAGGLEVKAEGGKLNIVKEGRSIKFKKNVEQITFSGQYAQKTGQEVLYLTERAVFKLSPEGLELIEIAPGIDLEKDILANMEFKPIMKNVRQMDERIFCEELMGLEVK